MVKDKRTSKFEKSILIVSLVGIIFSIFMGYNSLNGFPYIGLELSMNIVAILFIVIFIGMCAFIFFSFLNMHRYNKKVDIFRKELKDGDVANFGSDVVNILEIDGEEATIVIHVQKSRLYPLN